MNLLDQSGRLNAPVSVPGYLVNALMPNQRVFMISLDSVPYGVLPLNLLLWQNVFIQSHNPYKHILSNPHMETIVKRL